MALEQGAIAGAAPGVVDVATNALLGEQLEDLHRAMAACTDIEQLRGLLADRLPTLLPVKDRVSIALVDADGEFVRVHRLLPTPAQAGAVLPRVKIEGTPVGQVVREGRGRIVEDTRTDPNITFGQASHDGIRSTVSVPISVDGRIIGALNAGTRAIGVCTNAMLTTLAAVAEVIGPAFYTAEQAFTAPPAPASPAPRSRELAELIGASAPFTSLLGTARRAARSDADILITGETGVGKTALARALHRWSPRADGPFVTIHLADLTPTLVESELFGYERGAFTGASTARVGRFESARGGTIFLDEISETPIAIQTKLLRIIQDRCFERVGGGRTIETDVRIIAATSRDLRSAVQRGEFREDLYYRLSVVPLHVPPLRERTSDLELLINAILARIQGADRKPRPLAPVAWAKLRSHGWPGNIRELESVLRRATILEEGDELVLADFDVAASSTSAPPVRANHWCTLDEHERDYIKEVLLHLGGVIEGAQGAARVLGVPPSTLRSRMKRLGITVGKGRAR